MSAPTTSTPTSTRGAAAAQAPVAAGHAWVDYDLHGLVGIRLIGASAGDAAAVTRQLGPVQAPLARDPDITIR
ncbi:MAG TPA: hypothetical protein PKD53_09445, partial [Chloroflexaceae bacterium]|nr:hypothetical protein [Chloroflexaceae bacterium]